MKTAIRIVLSIIAIALIIVGAVFFIAPTPFGIFIVSAGFLLLAAVAPGILRKWRTKWPWLDRRLDGLERKGPGWLARILHNSDPSQDDTPDENEEEEDDDEPGTSPDQQRNQALASSTRRPNPLRNWK